MFWGDYFGDTMHLTTEEHGAYLLLLGTYWRRGKPLPDDDRDLATVTKMTPKKWKMVRPKISEFFDISEGVWRHKRVEKEILKSSARLSSARAAGKAGGKAKRKLTTTTTTKDSILGTSSKNGASQDIKAPDAAVFDLGKKLCGTNAGGLIKKLIDHHGGDLTATWRALKDAETKSDPREYIGGVLKTAAPSRYKHPGL